ncbi:hypothetical protein HYY71_04555 [Candidatus Woesearchaeota archaeon]|nr:hypothetical protein [Candidatus Woesearchaeota archaeon]
MSRTLEEKIPDFVLSGRNGVVAVYVRGPHILTRDDPTLKEVPFIFYAGLFHDAEVASLRQSNVPYLQRQELERLLKMNPDEFQKLVDTLNSGVPREVQVRGKGMPSYQVDNSRYVPYSFHKRDTLGRSHKSDIKGGTKVRALNDYTTMVQQILPKALAERDAENTSREFNASRLNRVLAFLHLRKPPVYSGSAPTRYSAV